MNDNLVALSKKHRIEQKKLQMALGSDFAHPEIVFSSATGNYKDRSSLNTSLKRFLKGTEFEYLTLHKLRHPYVKPTTKNIILKSRNSKLPTWI